MHTKLTGLTKEELKCRLAQREEHLTRLTSRGHDRDLYIKLNNEAKQIRGILHGHSDIETELENRK
jgi:hypothetical protein